MFFLFAEIQVDAFEFVVQNAFEFVVQNSVRICRTK